MNLQNRSSPALVVGPYPQSEELLPPVPARYDPAAHLQDMRLNDPIYRGGTPIGYYPPQDPIPRTGTAMSNRSHQGLPPPGRTYLPRHAGTMPTYVTSPPSGGPGPGDTSSVYSTHSTHSDGNVDAATPLESSPEGDLVNSHLFDSRGSSPHPMNGYSQALLQHYAPNQRGLPPNQYPPYAGPPGPPGYPSQPPPPNNQYYDTYYAAASDVLGMAPPPPGAQLARIPTQSSGSSGNSYMQPPGPYGPPCALDIPSQASQGPSSASMLSPISAMSTESRPSLHRSGTSASIDLSSRRKAKAVDLRAPPYTKEYVDDYRQRIKADPDPEAHFAYAKYLIEAAKKIGADSPDHRAVRKYRDALIAESLNVIRRLATQGNAYPEAQFFLANCYGTGMLGLQVDHERAYHLYLQAAKQNHPAASYRVAVCNEIGAGTRKEPPRAFAFYRKAASLGDTAAMYKLGMILLNGLLGQQKNPREAIGWLRRAAEQADEENPHALHELGLLHEMKDNSIVIHDEAYAKELFTKAAQLGYTPSQFKLGQCFEYGTLTCLVDPRRSIAWYTKAAEKGDPEAELALSGWYLTGSEGVLKQSDSEAYLWARRAANKGLSKAEYAVGYYAEVGIGVKQDMELAKRWYMRAASTLLIYFIIQSANSNSCLFFIAQGNKRAMTRLTELKRLGNKKTNQGRPTRAQTRDECVIT